MPPTIESNTHTTYTYSANEYATLQPHKRKESYMLTIQKRFPVLQTATMSIGVLSIGFVGSLATLNFYHPGRNTNSSTSPTLSSITPSSKTTAIPIDSTESTNSSSNSTTSTGSTKSQIGQPSTTWPRSTYQPRPAQAVQPTSNPAPSVPAPVIAPATPAPLVEPAQSNGTTPPASAPAAPAPQPIGTGLPLTQPLSTPTLPAIPLVN